MEIKRLVLGMFRTNCYLVYDRETKKTVIIDPGAEADRIKTAIKELGLVPEAVLLTHGHFDHMMAAGELREEYHIPIGLLREEETLLSDPAKNCSAMFIHRPFGICADAVFEDGQVLPFLDGALCILTTPGHTAGSACYYAAGEGVLFSGDTLFCGGVGRTDLPTAKPAMLSRVIKEKLFVLDEDTTVLPGHGEDTTIGVEKRYNPYVV